MSNSLRPHGLQHARLPCPSPTPRACSNSCPSLQWYHPTISSSKLITKGMLPISLYYTKRPISGSPASQVMSIKLKYLCLAHRKHSDQAHLWITMGRRKLTHSLWRLTGTRNVWVYSLTPTLFSIEEAWILTQARWFLGTLVRQLLGSSVPCPQNSSVGLLACDAVSTMSLDSATEMTQDRSPQFCGTWWHWRFGGYDDDMSVCSVMSDSLWPHGL